MERKIKKNMSKTKTKWIVLTMLILVGICSKPLNSSAAYRVDRYGELYYYSGSSVVTIRSNVSAISSDAFSEVKISKFITSGNSYFKTVDGVLISKDGRVLVKCPTEKTGTFTVPATVTKIEDNAFSGCKKLTKVSMSGSVKTIGKNAFKNCIELREVTIGSKVTTIQDSMFENCGKLRGVQIPSSVTRIGNRAFRKCSSIQQVKIPNSVRYIGELAFGYCSSLKQVVFSKNVSEVAAETFYECEKLEKVLNFKNVEEIGYDAFHSCHRLSKISFGNGLERISQGAFIDCYNLGTVFIPKSVEYISNSAFIAAASKFEVDSENPDYSSVSGMLLDAEGTYLYQVPFDQTGTLKIPKSVKKIYVNALKDGEYTSVVIPEGVTTISKSHFDSCTKLKTIYLPATLKKIKDSTWYGYNKPEKLESIHVAKGNPHMVSVDGVVYSVDKKDMLFFPYGRTGSITLPGECKEIDYSMQENKLSKIMIEKDGKHFSAQSGVLYNANGTEIRCFPMKKKHYHIPASLKTVSYLIRNKENMRCEKITVDAKNKKYYAKDGVLFNKNDKKMVYYPPKKKGSYQIPSSVKYVSNRAFNYCTGLTSLKIGKNLKRERYSYLDFYKCINLKSVKVKQGNLNYISMDFDGCKKLKTLTFPSNIMTTDLRNLPKSQIVIYGWENTGAKEAAQAVKGTFKKIGTIPAPVRGGKLRKIIDKYQLTWNISPESNGYQIYTSYETIATISGSHNTSYDIPEEYSDSDIYIRAYKIVKGKKVYGKAKKISV